jgi:hypothetical protein
MTRCEGREHEACRLQLRELGRIEGRNLVIDVRGAEGSSDRLPVLIAELVGEKPDIVVAITPQPARVAKNATATIPIVFVSVADPISLGIVTNLARPGGNVTGLTTLVPGGFVARGKRGRLLHPRHAPGDGVGADRLGGAHAEPHVRSLHDRETCHVWQDSRADPWAGYWTASQVL